MPPSRQPPRKPAAKRKAAAKPSAPRRLAPPAGPGAALREAVRKILPAALRDGELQADILARALGAPPEGPDRYRFEWAGKNDAVRRYAAAPAGTLVPDLGRSRDFFVTRQVCVAAENLEALKILAPAYAGRVKLIYIDPPYNTGNDFVYNDKFAVGSRQYLAAENGKDSKAAFFVCRGDALNDKMAMTPARRHQLRVI